MTAFTTLDSLRAACLDLPGGDEAAAGAVAARQARLTKPPGSLGRLEELAACRGTLRLAGTPTINTFNGRVSVELELKDFQVIE